MKGMKTGSLALDILTGGWRRGALIDLQGPPGSGKTTIAQRTVELLPDHEAALWLLVGAEFPSRTFATRGDVLFALPGVAEKVFEAAEMGLDAGVSLVVVDNADGLIRQAELDDPGYQWHPQREFKDELSSLKASAARTGGSVLFLSSVRARTMARGTGISEKVLQKVTLRISRDRQDGRRTIEAQSYGGTAQFDVTPLEGIDPWRDILEVSADLGVVKVYGSWYEIVPGEHIQGIRAACDYLRDNPEVAMSLEQHIRSLSGTQVDYS